ncbi:MULTISPECIES: hypothetical protein [unclassified Anabaena]|uniref:hypothetical protein n=1 Tax=unclassified Anabaena TaxID=2619674 RepID=UPI001445F12A|nr:MULTISPECIES: hypothetical protein [unclassified Anabaena]
MKLILSNSLLPKLGLLYYDTGVNIGIWTIYVIWTATLYTGSIKTAFRNSPRQKINSVRLADLAIPESGNINGLNSITAFLISVVFTNSDGSVASKSTIKSSQ